MKHSQLCIKTDIEGVFLLKLPHYNDERGLFCKIYNSDCMFVPCSAENSYSTMMYTAAKEVR